MKLLIIFNNLPFSKLLKITNLKFPYKDYFPFSSYINNHFYLDCDVNLL